MGRLFTYMVKAAAGEQPAPGPEFYTFWVDPKPLHVSSLFPQYAQLKRGRGVPYSPSGWNNLATHFSHITGAGKRRDYAQQANFAKKMFDASMSSNANAFFGIKGAANYATALNSNFTSPAAIYDYLKDRSEYQAALHKLADKGSWTELQDIWANAGDAPGMTDPTWGWRSDYQLSSGAGNAQLILNMYMAEKARRDAAKAAQQAQKDEEARKKAKEAQQADLATSDPEKSPVTAPGTGQPPAKPTTPAPGQPTVKVVKDGEGSVRLFVNGQEIQPVAVHRMPKGTSVVTGPDGKQYVSSTDERKAQTAAGIGALLEARQNPFAGARTAAPGASGPTRVNMNAAQDAVLNQVNSNINAGRSMYSNMGDAGKFMTAGQKLALTTYGFAGNQQQQDAALAAAKQNARNNGQQIPQSEHDAYTGAGLRMVGHSADGKTRTYVGKSGRGRITVGDNAAAGHYRGVGAVDTNTRSNYADIRQPNAPRAVAASPVRKSPTTPR